MKPATELRKSIADAEWQRRLELAAAYRLMDHFGVRDLTYNHLSARVPGEADAILIKPGDFMFGEVTASSLRKIRTSTDGRCSARTGRSAAAPWSFTRDWRGAGRT